MTFEEFDNTKFRADMVVIYKGMPFELAQVDFEERLIGFVERDNSGVSWARCENVEIQ